MSRTCRHCGGSIDALPLGRNYCGRSCSAHASRNKRHGLTDNPEHRTWTRIRERCNNPNHKDYPRYGGRGIRVCARWDSFESFLEDMGPRNGLTIDRIDNERGYEPGNCRWATPAEQNKNKRNLYTTEQDSKIRDAVARGLNFTQMAKLLGKSVAAVSTRAYRIGLRSGVPPIPKKIKPERASTSPSPPR